MKPYYQDDNCTIYHGDCREILPQLEPVDLVLTDPPYGINANKQTLGKGKKDFYRGSNWDAQRQNIAWIPTFAKWYCVWGGNYYADVLPVNNHLMVWHKLNDNRSFSECELAWSNSGKNIRIKSHHWGGELKQHPTQKPLDIIKWCIGFFPNAQTILDPFMGSGTTLRAAKDLNRKAIGIEIEEKYCEIAVERLRQEVLAL